MKTRTFPNLFVVMCAFAFFSSPASADTRAGGETTNTNVILNNVVDEATDIWEVLESEGLTLTTSSRCIVTACSDVLNQSSTTLDNDYRFVIAVDDTSPGINTSSERSLELSDNGNGVDDPNVWPVCSTRFVNVSSGTHTIYWLGSRVSASDVQTEVDDTTLSIGCFDGTEL